jgi:alpha-beta hydrolase superfamily lysophospholipase
MEAFSGYTLAALDLPGCGETSRPDDQPDVFYRMLFEAITPTLPSPLKGEGLGGGAAK